MFCVVVFSSPVRVEGSGWAVVITCHLSSVVCPSVHGLLTPLNDFSSETPWPIFFRLYMEISVNGETKTCSNGYGSLIKMATMPIYGKNTHKFSSPEPRKLLGWILVHGIRDSRSTKFVQMMIVGWSLTFLQHGHEIVCCVYMYSLESPHQGSSNEYTHHTMIMYKIEKKKESLNNRYLLPDLASWFTLSGLNYPCLE